jgi:hypothetical protein
MVRHQCRNPHSADKKPANNWNGFLRKSTSSEADDDRRRKRWEEQWYSGFEIAKFPNAGTLACAAGDE